MPENVDQPDRAYMRGVIDGTYGETLDGHDGASRAHIAGSPPSAPWCVRWQARVSVSPIPCMCSRICITATGKHSQAHT